MANNLYGGYLYPGTPFMFDITYNNYKEAQDNVNKDGVLIGRFILVSYCKMALSQTIRSGLALEVEEATAPIAEPSAVEETEANNKEWWKYNYYQDHKLTPLVSPADRKIYQKIWDTSDKQFKYIEIATLNATIDNQVENNIKTWAQTYADDIRLEYTSQSNADNTTKSAYLQLYRGQGTERQNLGNKIDISELIKDGMISSVQIQDENLVITWNTDAGIDITAIPLDSIVDVYNDGKGIKIDRLNNKFDINLKNTEDFLTADTYLSLTEAAQQALTWQKFTK